MQLDVTWDLESIFPGGSRSPRYARFMTELEQGIEGLAAAVAELGPDLQRWAAVAELWQQRSAQLGEAYSFVGCLEAQNTADAVATQLAGRLDALEARLKTIEVDIETAMLGVDDDAWQQIITSQPLAPIAFFLGVHRDLARRKMAPEQEALAETLATDGYHAWNRLYEKLAGSLRAEVVINGAPSSLSMGQLVHRLEDRDAAVRRDAFAKLEGAWESVEDLSAMALNSQAGFRLSMYRRRGWDSVLFEPLQQNRMRAATLDAMWDAVQRESHRLVPYLQAKSRVLGQNGMRWCDLAAPVSTTERRVDYGDAADYITERFAAFSGDLADFARHAFTERWIEVEDRPGKAAGGFCTDLPLSKQTRIFMTYGQTFGGVTTLAHELGHSFHAWLLKDRPYFATAYPMVLAETASTFCESLIMDAALEEANDRDQQLALLGSIADEAVSMLMNLRARFLFELAFFEQRASGPLTAEELSGLMVDAQRRAYCDGLEDDGYHPRFWAAKLHFYITSAPFYNFPYVFGYLFSNGLYARAQQEGASFNAAYMRLLEDTGVMSCEELAQRHLGVDLTQPDFWTAAVDRVLQAVPRFTAVVDG